MRDDLEKYNIIILIITIFLAREYKRLIIVLFELFIMIIFKPAAFSGREWKVETGVENVLWLVNTQQYIELTEL